MAITVEENELLTRTGQGTPMGTLFRQYWFPAMLSERLPEPECAPVAVTLLGERLVAYRDKHGKVGLMDEFCPHRRASLAYGRCEDGGIRCIFHGWLVDADGVKEAPPERHPERFAATVQHTSYPTYEAGGIIWTYMGKGDPAPPPPDFSFMNLPEENLLSIHYYQECNYLQGIEADVDLVHSCYLHSSYKPSENAMAGEYRVADVLAMDGAPAAHVYDTPWGFYNVWEYQITDEDKRLVWVHPFVFPFYTIVGPSRRDGVLIFHAWVPVDDEHHMFYYVHFRPEGPLDEEARHTIITMLGHDKVQKLNEYRSEGNLSNRHFQSQERLRTVNFSGIDGIAAQDIAVLQSMQPIVDRTKEHLGSEDATVRWLRRRLMEAAKQAHGESTPGPGAGAAPLSRSGLDGYIRIVPNDVPWEKVVELGPEGSAHFNNIS